MEKFVCVRIIQANRLDLSLFQFDYDLTFAAMFLNADRTIYGRYGTRSEENLSHDLSLASFRKAMEAVLKLHEEYPRNRKSLRAKRGPASAFRIPEDYPTLKKFYGNVTVRPGKLNSCLHCHQIHNNYYREYRRKNLPIPDKLLWAYPMPDWLGLEMDLSERATVESVKPGSSAERDGFKAGDEILTLGGQPIVSIADLQWALKHAKGKRLRAKVLRGGSTRVVTLSLPRNWRRKGDFAWRASTEIFRPIPEGSHDLTADERKARGLPPDAVAIVLRWDHRRAGLEKGDLIVEIDGLRKGMTTSDFYAYCAQKKMPGDTIRVKVLRGGKEFSKTLTLEYRE